MQAAPPSGEGEEETIDVSTAGTKERRKPGDGTHKGTGEMDTGREGEKKEKKEGREERKEKKEMKKEKINNQDLVIQPQ